MVMMMIEGTDPALLAAWHFMPFERLKDGRKVGGIDFSTASLANLLHNRFYIGEVDYKGEILKGPQEPILDRALFDQVQEKFAAQRIKRAKTNAKGNSLLTGRIFDDRGNGMTPTYAVKNGVHYRYYISTPLLHGKSEIAGTVARVPAADVEDTIVKALRERLEIKELADDRTLLQTYVERVEIQTNRLVVTLKPDSTKPPSAAKNAQGKIGRDQSFTSRGPSRPRNEGATLCCRRESHATRPGPSKPRVGRSLSHRSPRDAGGSKNSSAVKPKIPRKLPNASAAASAKSI